MKIYEFFKDMRKMLADTQEPYLWEDDELLSYLNDVLFFSVREAGLIELKYEFNTQISVQSYNLPDGVEYVMSVYCNNRKLTETSYDTIENLSEVGVPEYFAVNPENKVLLYPIPDKEYNVVVYYVGNIISPLKLEDNLPIPDWFILFLKHGIAWRAYMKEDTEIFDLKLAQYHRQEFMAGVNLLKARHTRDTDISYPSYIHRGLL